MIDNLETSSKTSDFSGECLMTLSTNICQNI